MLVCLTVFAAITGLAALAPVESLPALAVPAKNPADTGQPPATETRRFQIITLGDSITKGVRPGVATNETFAALLEARLRADGFAVDVRNVGLGGERTDQALARLERAVLQPRPDWVTVMYGTNDSYVDPGRREARLTVGAYRTNLVTLVQRLRAAGVQPVLMTPPPWGNAARTNGVGEHPNVRLEPFVRVCREVATEHAVPLVDHFAAWSERAAAGFDIGQWTTDQCHPNPAGHRVLAAAILPVLRPLLGKVR